MKSKNWTIEKINEKNVQAYLAGQISLLDLSHKQSPYASWRIVENRLEIVPWEEYAKRLNKQITQLRITHGRNLALLPIKSSTTQEENSKGDTGKISFSRVCVFLRDSGTPADGCPCRGNVGTCDNPRKHTKECFTGFCTPRHCIYYEAKKGDATETISEVNVQD